MSDTPTPSPKPIRKKLSMFLPCKLTPEEFEQRAKALARTEEEFHEEEERQKAVKDGLKKELSDITSRRAMLATIVSRGSEDRDVACEELFDWADATVTRTRMDTSEVLVVRPMTNEERQRGLFGEV